MNFDYLPDREHGFIRVINNLGYKIGIEIGVRDGLYSELLLNKTQLEKLYSVDCVKYQGTIDKLVKFGNRSEFRQSYSVDAANEFPDGYFDFIYIDAAHDYAGVKQDMEVWWPKLSIGGLMCGDDYTYVHNPSEGPYGVVQAVNEFARTRNLKLGVTSAGIDTYEEYERIARGYGKIIEAGLRREINIVFGSSSDLDDIRIPQWYIFKEKI